MLPLSQDQRFVDMSADGLIFPWPEACRLVLPCLVGLWPLNVLPGVVMLSKLAGAKATGPRGLKTKTTLPKTPSLERSQ